MSQNKKAVAGAGTPQTARANGVLVDGDLQHDYTTPAKSSASVFWANALQHGPENATPAAVLAARLHISERTLRAQIKAARNSGVPILIAPGGRGGYFLPSLDPQQARAEIAAYERQANKRAVGTLAALAPARRALAVPAGQMEFAETAGHNTGSSAPAAGHKAEREPAASVPCKAAPPAEGEAPPPPQAAQPNTPPPAWFHDLARSLRGD